jgi:hypothetical protein
MPESAVSSVQGVDSHPEAALRSTQTVPGGDAADFEEQWDELLHDVQEAKTTDDIADRLSRDRLDKAYGIAASHHTELAISEEPYGRATDMPQHVRDHFDTVFNNDDVGKVLKMGGRPHIDALLKLCELLYIDDAVLRFGTEITFRPSADTLQNISFAELPPELDSEMCQWMGDVEVVWDTFLNNTTTKDHLVERIDELYNGRKGFIDKAQKQGVFLPPTAKYTDDRLDEKYVRTRIMRNASVPASHVHDTIYSRVFDLLN